MYYFVQYSVTCALYSIQYSAHFTLVHIIHYTLHCTLYTVHCTLFIPQCTMSVETAQSTVDQLLPIPHRVAPCQRYAWSHCTVVHCNVLHYTVLHCTVVHCTVLVPCQRYAWSHWMYCTARYYIALYCKTLHNFMVPANSCLWSYSRNIKEFHRYSTFIHSQNGFIHHSSSINFVLRRRKKTSDD